MVEQILFGPGGATEATLEEILATLKNTNALRLDYTGGPTGSDPVYIGSGAYDAAESSLVWTVRKLTYSGSNIVKIETRPDASWTSRATPTPAWD